MNSKNILKVKRPIKPQTPPPPLNDSAIEAAVVALQQLLQWRRNNSQSQN